MEANMQVLEGAQYRLRVKLTNEAGEQLPPELFRVYAGAFCPGYAPAHFHAERTAEEWVLTMPGLKPGRVPWNWQVIAAEYATGVEWLLTAGEVTVTPRHATGSGCVDPGELKIVATLDKTTLQMTVQIGESTAACSLAVVAAQNSAKEAAGSATAAAEQAQAARISASAAAKCAEAAAQALKENAGGGANSAELTDHTENTEIHVTAAERESWNRTSGNFKVVTEWNEARPIILEDRTAYLPLLATNELSNLWLEPPTPMPETFVATLEFSSGETATRYRGTGITWSGDDVVNGVFVPQANTRYSCVFYYTGHSFCGEVSAERYLSTHVSDTTKHITEDERTKWNAAAENAGGSSEVMSEKWLVQTQMPCFFFIDADDVMTDNSTHRIEAFHTLTDATSADPMRAVLTSLIGSITAKQAKSIVSVFATRPEQLLLTPLY